MTLASSTLKGVSLMAFSALCVCLGQLMWKLSANGSLGMLMGGFVLYGVGALAMLYAYRFGKLSILQPVLSLSYVLSLLLAVLVLGETVGILKIVGTVAIIGGLVLITRGET